MQTVLQTGGNDVWEAFLKSYYADHVFNKWQTLIPQYRSIETGQTVLLVHFLFTSRFNLFFSNRRG